MRHLLSAILLWGGLCAIVRADVWLESERITLTLSHSQNWMPSWATYNDVLYQNGLAANAPVMRLTDTGFVGAVHGQESLLSVSITADGLPFDFLKPIARGSMLHLTRQLSFDGAYQVTHDLTLSGMEIQERSVFTGLDPNRTVDIFYPTMASRANTFTHWMTFDAAGQMLTEGLATADNESFTHFPVATRAVAMFDPEAGIGTVMRWAFDPTLNGRAFLWDRGAAPLNDNKLYLRLLGAEGAADKQLETFQRTTLFESTVAEWSNSAKAWAAPTPGDANADGRVDLDDFGLLKANFGGTGLAIPGDLNFDGEIDLSDFGLLKANFGREPWPPVQVQAVPEPAAWLLAALAAAGLALGLRRAA
jgi:hypothetical protein